MERQLVLLDQEPADWRLDEQTRAVGRAGLVEARAALRVALQRREGGDRRAA